MAQPLLTFEQIRDVQDQLRQPLTGRPVLIPLGPKAFIPGFLQPEKKDDDEMVTYIPAKNGSDKESQQTTILSRTHALDRLQEEMDQVSNRKKTPPVKQQSTTSISNVLPYFEIREEIDSTGKEVKAEAVDVSLHLEYLRQHPEMVQEDTLPPAVTTAASSEPVEEIPVTDLKPLSDGEYDALAARLEALAKLEEAESKEPVPKVLKKSNHKAASGWSKGFLNNSNTKKKKELDDKKVISLGAREESVNVNKSTGQSTKHDMPATPAASKPISKRVFSGVIQEHNAPNKTNNVSNQAQAEPSSPRVRFGGDEQNEIREIPRIGETSVATIARQPSRPIFGSGNLRQESQQEVPKKKLSRFAMERQQLNR